MDAVKKEYKIWFGGSYQEHWDRNYVLSVSYENRKWVIARRCSMRWEATAGDGELCSLINSSDCPTLLRQYFEAGASVYEALEDCRRRAIGFDRLRECFYITGNPLAAPELMRTLMDECGISLTLSYHIAAHCCGELKGEGVELDKLAALQPRTAAVLRLLRYMEEKTLSVACDTRESRCRKPYGAVCCGDSVSLGFRVLGGSFSRAVLLVYGDEHELEYPMERQGNMVTATFDAPESPAPLWYCFRIETQEGTLWLCPDGTGFIGRLFDHRVEGFRLTVYLRDFETPEWFRHAVMYQIFPDRFAFSSDDTAQKGIEYHRALRQTPELHASLDEPLRYLPRPFESAYSPDDFYGGTFAGIASKLDYLKELGVSCVYLNPIVESRSNHRYDASDYLKPDPVLGTEKDFAELCEKAAALGIRIILDGVFSHTGADSIYFNRFGNYPSVGACQGESSKFFSWYDFRRFPDEYRCWWNFKDLPEVDERNPKWQDFIISGKDSVVKTWLRRGASGWRLDVADELPEEALSLIRTAAKAEKPDAPIIGEVWEDAVNKVSLGQRRRYALGYSLDSVMNYPMRTAVLDFIHRRCDAYGLRDFLIGQKMNYPKPLYYSLMNLLGSHDVERLRTALATETVVRTLPREAQLSLRFSDDVMEKAVKLEKLCAVLQFTLPGVPCIYYGDEQGMTGVCDPFNRAPFRYAQPTDAASSLPEFYAMLAARRNANAALSTGKAEFFALSSDILAVLRYIGDGKDVFEKDANNAAFLILVNRGGEAEYSVDCTDAGLGVLSGTVDACTAKIEELTYMEAQK